MDSVTCKFKISKHLNTQSPVYLANFSNGHLNVQSTENLNFKSYRHSNDENGSDFRARRILGANNDRLIYSGTCFNENGDSNKHPLRYFVGVRKKSTGKMKLYNSVFFHLKPRPSRKAKNSVSTSREDKTFKEQLDELTSSFGSKGKKRALSAHLKYSVDSSPLIQAISDMSVAESNQSVSSPNSSEIDYIPPRNSEAQFVDDVYNIRDIISIEDDQYLTDFVEKLNNSATDFEKLKNSKIYCKYVSSRLENASDNDKMKMLLYYNYLVIFAKLKYSDIRKKDPTPDIPEPIKTNLLNCFTLTSSLNGRINRNFPTKMKDKLVAYLLVLALFIDNFCVDLSSVCADIKMGLPKLTIVAHALGCHVNLRKVQDTVVKYAELKLPLYVMQRHYKKF